MKISAFALLTALVPLILFTPAKAEDHILAPLSNQSAIVDCSWSASSKRVGKGDLFQAEFDNSKAVMNINGIDTEFTRSSQHGHLQKLGSIMTAIYRAKGVVVYATYKTTWLCPTDDTSESCEVTRFDATYEVRTGSGHQIVNATGSVGC